MSPRPDVSEERKQQIFEAAINCFNQKGYHLTKMDDIAAAAGLSKGALYWYFKSKKALFLALFQELMGDFEHTWQVILADQSRTATQKLCTSLAMFRLQLGEFSSFFGVMLEAWAQTLHDDEVVSLLDEFYKPYVRMMTDLIEDGIATNEFRVKSAEATSVAIMSLLDGVTLALGTGIIQFDWEQLFDAVSDLILRGLGVEQDCDNKQLDH